MGAGYKLIALADARPGQVLSDVLLDRVGQVLLPKGAVLSEGNLAALERHGVAMLPVVMDKLGAPDPALVRERLDRLFRHPAGEHDSTARARLRRYVEEYRLGSEVAP
ncbi:hypothetical protein NX774_18125 [Massilia agilis]|uniref:Uncharacterized protein n=1 Tax=Massilia agilis TaxID=1811226 RepID=A0ABT2DET4_9BURK|nr:hypothetical protein [Massilia agilis]MCS0809845.1 hypothetical protein [Massilia agilis]